MRVGNLLDRVLKQFSVSKDVSIIFSRRAIFLSIMRIMSFPSLLLMVFKSFFAGLCEIKVEWNTYNEVYYKAMLFKGFRHVETYFVQLNTSVFANLFCVCVCVRAFPNHVQSTGRLQSSCRNDVLEQTKP